jgi:predicted porin
MQGGQAAPAQGAPNLLAQLGARYNVGPVSAGVNYQPGVGVGGDMQYSQGPVSAEVNYQPGAGLGGGLQYNQGPFSAGAGYDPRRGAYGDIAMRQNFARGGFAVK